MIDEAGDTQYAEGCSEVGGQNVLRQREVAPLEFDTEYENFLQMHRKGDASQRLHEDHGHTERELLQRVWSPAFRHFDGLPEYEGSQRLLSSEVCV